MWAAAAAVAVVVLAVVLVADTVAKKVEQRFAGVDRRCQRDRCLLA